MKKFAFGLSIVIALLVMAGGAYTLGTRSSKKPVVSDVTAESTNDQPIQEAPKNPDAVASPAVPEYGACSSSSGAKVFYDKIIGLQFCYPASWGSASVGNIPGSASDLGGAYEITFSSKDRLTIASKTIDYKNTVARDGRCADPVIDQPQFSTFSTKWHLEAYSALRVHIKKEPRYLVRELVDDYFGGVCYMTIVSTPGGAYPVQLVNLQRAYNTTVTNPSSYIDNPDVLILASEKNEYLEMIDSMRRAE